MNALADEYRRQAAYCEEMADSAVSHDLRAEWLRLAGNWLAQLPYKEPFLPNNFDAMMAERGAHRQEATSSH